MEGGIRADPRLELDIRSQKKLLGLETDRNVFRSSIVLNCRTSPAAGNDLSCMGPFRDAANHCV